MVFEVLQVFNSTWFSFSTGSRTPQPATKLHASILSKRSNSSTAVLRAHAAWQQQLLTKVRLNKIGRTKFFAKVSKVPSRILN